MSDGPSCRYDSTGGASSIYLDNVCSAYTDMHE